jgi:flagellar biosynthesis protein FlhF
MRMRTITAPTMVDAMRQIREEMGPDAVVLTTHYRRGEVEVRAALDTPSASLAQARPAPPIWSPPTQPSMQIVDLLTWHGINHADAVGFSRAAASISKPGAGQGIAAALETRLTFEPVPPSPRRPLIFVGAAGAGRSSVTARLAARAASATGAVDLIAIEDGTPHQAANLGWLSGLGERAVQMVTPDRLPAALARRAGQTKPVLIDGLSTNPVDHESVEVSRSQIADLDVEPVLVLSAEGHPNDVAESARVFASLGATRLIVTKLDLVRRRGAPVIAALAGGLKIAHLGMEALTGVGLVPATPARLTRMLIEAAEGAVEMRGVA